MKRKNILISGAGIAGCFLAILLARKGYKVSIYEKLSIKEAINFASSRSYNITFFGFGLRLLKKTELWSQIEPFTTKLVGSATHFSKSASSIVVSPKKNSPYFAVSRAEVLNIFIKNAKKLGCKFYFESPILKINKDSSKVIIANARTGKTKEIIFDLAVGCDGVNSEVRNSLIIEKNSKLTKELSEWTYKQFIINSEKAEKLSMPYNFANTWSDKKFVIVAFPNKDKSHTTIVITKEKTETGFDDIKKAFPALTILNDEFKSLKRLRMGRFTTIHTSPWFYKDNIVILGDSAHGFNPFFGQGVSAALGDAYVLSNLIDKNNGLKKFQDLRKIHMDTLGNLSNEGFKRYRRDKRIDYDAVYFKIESILHAIFPKFFVAPVFESITWDPGSTNNYVVKHKKQRKLLSRFGVDILVKFSTKILSSIT